MGIAYMGGKSQIAKKIIHTISPLEPMWRPQGVSWCEPFVGGAHVISHVGGVRYANDLDSELISLFQAVARGYEPPKTVSRNEYYKVKSNPQNYEPEYVGFISICCSFGSKKWGGFAQGNGKDRVYYRAGANALRKMAHTLKDIIFSSVDYREMTIPDNSIIYCDPPYKNTASYKCGPFNHDEFYQWCRAMSEKGHKVFISEYQAPDDFILLWAHEVNMFLNANSNLTNKTECLFLVP